MYLYKEDIDSSRTDIPGAADLIIGYGTLRGQNNDGSTEAPAGLGHLIRKIEAISCSDWRCGHPDWPTRRCPRCDALEYARSWQKTEPLGDHL